MAIELVWWSVSISRRELKIPVDVLTDKGFNLHDFLLIFMS